MSMPPSPRRAVFFDRDGTLIEQVELLHTAYELVLFPDAAAATARAHAHGYLVIIVTNQPVVARGIISEDELRIVNDALYELLTKQGGHVDAVYYCPHHPHATVERYRTTCDCRKPLPGLLLRAAKEHDLDLAQSFLIGDSTQDVAAGNAAGVDTILVSTGHGGHDPWQHPGTPCHTVQSLSEALDIISQGDASTDTS